MIVSNIALYLLIVLMYMWGGQKTKAVRRFGVPLATLAYYWKERAKADGWLKAISVTLLALVLSMGYGENSKLMGLLKSESYVRIVYSLLLWLPVGFLFWSGPISLLGIPALIAAFQVRAGGFKIGKTYDFLYEDLLRSSALWFAIII